MRHLAATRKAFAALGLLDLDHFSGGEGFEARSCSLGRGFGRQGLGDGAVFVEDLAPFDVDFVDLVAVPERVRAVIEAVTFMADGRSLTPRSSGALSTPRGEIRAVSSRLPTWMLAAVPA